MEIRQADLGPLATHLGRQIGVTNYTLTIMEDFGSQIEYLSRKVEHMERMVGGIHQVSQEMVGSYRVKLIMELVFGLLAELYGCRRGILLWKKGAKLVPAGVLGMEKGEWTIETRGLITYLKDKKPPLHLSNLSGPFLPFSEKGLDLLLPLWGKRGLAGLLLLGLERGSNPEGTEERFLRVLANFLVLSLQRERLYLRATNLSKRFKAQLELATREFRTLNKELKKKIYNLHNLFQVSTNVYAIFDINHLFNSLLLTILGQLGAKSVVIFLPAGDGEGRLIPRFCKGIREDEVSDLNLKREAKISRFIAQRGIPVLASQIDEPLLKEEEFIRLKKLELKLFAPLLVSGELMGIMALGGRVNGEQYHPEDLEMLAILTNMAGVAIGNVKEYKKVEKLSYTDGMTDLHNYRYFSNRLEEEIIRAKRYGRPLSLIILDIDYFKNYNDNLGHQRGDLALKELSEILRKSVRKIDVVSRYGGEEFCVIMPEVKSSGCKKFMERLKQKVEDHYFKGAEVQPKGKITISLGGATFPQDATSMDELIYKADFSLYEAKSRGRNRSVVYGELRSPRGAELTLSGG